MYLCFIYIVVQPEAGRSRLELFVKLVALKISTRIAVSYQEKFISQGSLLATL